MFQVSSMTPKIHILKKNLFLLHVHALLFLNIKVYAFFHP